MKFFSLLSLNAQERKGLRNQDVSLMARVDAPISISSSNPRTVGLTYARHNDWGAGFRAGVESTSSLMDVDNLLAIPIAFSYRTRTRTAGEKVDAALFFAGKAFESQARSYSYGSRDAKDFG